MFSSLIKLMSDDETFSRKAINLTPSENVLSPFARIPFSMDVYSRYFLDDLRVFGRWFFPGGMNSGLIEQDILVPLLKEMTCADHVNVRPISGLNCMMVAVAALTKHNDLILTVPIENGGHASTTFVANKFGLRVQGIPFINAYDVDLDRLAVMLKQQKPALIYIDQSTMLFPINVLPIRKLVDELSPNTLIHYDSSHINGLLLFDVTANPLTQGAHVFGGSTHKTLPGPHKGFLATNDPLLAEKIQNTTDHFVSHHHMSDMLSLAITLFELKECGGSSYAKQIVNNAKYFASSLSINGFDCAAAKRGYTDCHQVWVSLPKHMNMEDIVQRLRSCNINANSFNALPGMSTPSFRLSTAEITRLGANTNDCEELASILAALIIFNKPISRIKERVLALRSRINYPLYCYQLDDFLALNLSEEIKQFGRSIFYSSHMKSSNSNLHSDQISA